ncbi:MAG TPA: hypothetical protein VGG28_25705 [Kofleriaceae bacterium]
MTIVLTLVITAIAVAIGYYVDKRWMPKPEQLAEAGKPKLLAGESPAAAIRAKPAQLERLRASQRCECRAAMQSAGDDEAVRYDDRRLIVLHFTCPACGRNRSLYVEPTA